ncbi:MAG: DUF1636 domain-containing protein [Rhodobacteraceae bacterium]|jgi:predicted metal-binding protein|nr:hypothetical protein [Paracoccaceae bacterium]MBC8409567.1 DUF1636 domain-containing protein [Paracoccaceae bacterium]MBT4777708.1 DUF1636 domain-containing protein [Paracoccaceae bacterium]MDG1298931.1 DUF1636 domain-containing protein [Paracoccaceae bacterium]MDG2373937.1 DUF1636 domain-containing protein [Paracoccaceae bacterium]
MKTYITICETCKRETWSVGDMSLTDGERLASLVESLKDSFPGVITKTHPCLMGCSHGCNIAIQAENKMSYTLGNFEPTKESAKAILDYAQLHSENENGVVPYRNWPEKIKGHFITRHPPLLKKS